MTSIRLYAVLMLIAILMLVVVHASAARSDNTEDKCAAFDNWIGGQRFDYVVDAQGNWNLPIDATVMATITFPNAGIWKYYSARVDKSYIIVFLSLEPSQPAGQRAGQHDICVYELPGLGLGGS